MTQTYAAKFPLKSGRATEQHRRKLEKRCGQGTENYQVWSCAMLLALEGKNKYGFIDGSRRRSNIDQVLELKETYDKVDGSVTFNLHHKINSLSQNGSSIADYYHRFNALCKQFDALVQLPRCTCHAAVDFKKHNQLMKLMKILMGLDDSYMQIRSNILSREPLPSVGNAYAIISREESHRVVSSTGFGTSQRSQSSVFNSNVGSRNNVKRPQISGTSARPANVTRPFNTGNRRPNGESAMGRIVGIKRLLDDLRVTAAQRKDKDRRKDKDCLEIKITYVIKHVALRNFARRYGSRFYIHGGCIQSSHAQTANGNTAPKTTVVEGVEKVMPPTTTEEKAQKRLEVEARSTLMMGIPNEHQLKFNSIKDDKLLMKSIKKKFGRNAATKNTQKNLLKQQYKNFTALSSEMLNQNFDRLQKLVSQLELLGETISQEDVN
ncbi:ribonuclease H-like domain-containing protein [Tanacetum coccineum]